MSYRPYYLAQNFQRLGFNTTIITSGYHHLSQIHKAGLGFRTVDEQSFYFVESARYTGNGFGRLRNMFSFSINLFKESFRRFSDNNRPDVIIASTAHPFHIFAAKYYAFKFDAKLILEVRDLWPMSLQELLGLSKYHPLCLLISFAQNFGYRVSDHCVSLLENSEEYLVNQGLGSGRFTCIPNGVELSPCNNFSVVQHEVLDTLQRLIKDFDTVIGYTGAIGIPNNLEPLIQAANYIKKGIAIVIVGDGSEKLRLQKICNKLELDNVFFFDSVPKVVVSDIINCCDAMFINSLPKEIYKYGISPNKIFDYMLHDKPVFNGIDAPNNPLELSKSEIKFIGSDFRDLADKINLFHFNKYSFEISSSDYVKQFHSYSYLAEKYTKLFLDE
ncbi:glycosyltransferase family 4 protein [Shewanella seohaensis]|uniref:glycosyltransferase family 4 protein n=1 Tax=Shewanella seohaensis TaxID=755175 RepID=UPI0035B8AD50